MKQTDPYLQVVQGKVEDGHVKFTFTNKQYLYIYKCLNQASHQKTYIRDYMRNHRNTEGNNYLIQPILLIYLNDSEARPNSPYYTQIRAKRDGNNVILILSYDHAWYLQDALRKKYNRRIYLRAFKGSFAPKTKYSISILVEIVEDEN